MLALKTINPIATEEPMSFEGKANSVLEQARGIAAVVNSWADFSNALFGHKSGLVTRTFADQMEYQCFLDSSQYAEICKLLERLMQKFGVAKGGIPQKSGKFVVRIPKSLHEILEIESKAEGVSLNQLALSKLSFPLREKRTALDVSIVAAAYADVYDGFATDRVVVDPVLNRAFLKRCGELGAWGSAYRLNHALFDIRKSKKAELPKAMKRTEFRDMDSYRFASEIAVRVLQRTKGVSLDRILCDPELAQDFDRYCRSLVGEKSVLKLRWAALNLRKTHNLRPLDTIGPVYDLVSSGPVKSITLGSLPKSNAGYVFFDAKRPIYAGETENLRHRIELHLDKGLPSWIDKADDALTLRFFAGPKLTQDDRLRWLRWFINHERPLLNYQPTAA